MEARNDGLLGTSDGIYMHSHAWGEWGWGKGSSEQAQRCVLQKFICLRTPSPEGGGGGGGEGEKLHHVPPS